MRHLLPLLTTAVLVLVAVPAFATAPYFAPGDYQGWDINTAAELKDDGVAPDAAAGDGIYTADVVIATAGAYQYKVAETGWAAAWPGSGNSWFITGADGETVTLTFDENSYADGWLPDSFWPMSSHTTGATYTLVGSIGSQVGGNDWDPAGTLFLLDDGTGGDLVAGDGIYTFCAIVATAGNYEWKVAVNGDWAQQFGVDGPSVNAATQFIDVLADGDIWCFELDLNMGRVNSREDGAVQIEDSSWGQLKGLYR